METLNPFSLPRATKEDLARQADLYQRLAAAMRDRSKAAAMAELARKYAAMAEAAER